MLESATIKVLKNYPSIVLFRMKIIPGNCFYSPLTKFGRWRSKAWNQLIKNFGSPTLHEWTEWPCENIKQVRTIQQIWEKHVYRNLHTPSNILSETITVFLALSYQNLICLLRKHVKMREGLKMFNLEIFDMTTKEGFSIM